MVFAFCFMCLLPYISDSVFRSPSLKTIMHMSHNVYAMLLYRGTVVY